VYRLVHSLNFSPPAVFVDSWWQQEGGLFEAMGCLSCSRGRNQEASFMVVNPSNVKAYADDEPSAQHRNHNHHGNTIHKFEFPHIFAAPLLPMMTCDCVFGVFWMSLIVGKTDS
jgi:hypothetical protein